MFNIQRIARRGGGVAIAVGLAIGFSAPAMAATGTTSGFDPSHFVIAPEGPGLKAPAKAKAPTTHPVVGTPAPIVSRPLAGGTPVHTATVQKTTHAATHAVKATTCKAGTRPLTRKGVRTCVKIAPVRH